MATTKIESLMTHLSSEDVMKRKVALTVLEGLFKQKGHPQPPIVIIRAVLESLTMGGTEEGAITLLARLLLSHPELSQHFVFENMGLAVMWLFVATYSNEELAKMAERIINTIKQHYFGAMESDVTSEFFRITSESGRKWTEDGIGEIARQILTITHPKHLSSLSQKIIERESNLVPLLVFFLSHINNPSSLSDSEVVMPARLAEVVKDNGFPFMVQAFLKNTDPDAKSLALQGLRSLSNSSPEFEISFFDEIVKCITSPNRILQQEALLFASDFIPESFILNNDQ